MLQFSHKNWIRISRAGQSPTAASAILDKTMGWAPSLRLNRMFMTVELTTRLVKLFPVGKEMIVEAWPVKVTKRLVLVNGEIRYETGTVYVSATEQFLRMSDEESKAVSR